MEEKIEQENIDYKDLYLRALADLDNYKKNSIKARENYIKYKNEDIAKDLIEINSDILRGISVIPEEHRDSGLMLIYNKLQKVFEKNDIKIIPVNAGDDFDVNTMDAKASVPTDNPDKNNKVFSIMKEGYMLKDKVISFTEVVISTYSK